LFPDESDIIRPLEEDRPTITPEFQRSFVKTDEVIALLRHLPYIRRISHGMHAPQGTPACYWADWQSMAMNATGEAAAGEAAAGEAAAGEADGGTVDEGLKVCSFSTRSSASFTDQSVTMEVSTDTLRPKAMYRGLSRSWTTQITMPLRMRLNGGARR
jgi:hypothetical protein